MGLEELPLFSGISLMSCKSKSRARYRSKTGGKSAYCKGLFGEHKSLNKTIRIVSQIFSQDILIEL